MRIRKLLILCFLMGWTCSALALYTSEPFSDGPWSKEFRQAIGRIDRTDGTREEAGLLSMLDKYKESHEQVEIQFQLAILYNQRNGMVNHPKAVEHFAKAQKFDPPPQVRTLSHILCGDSFRIMKEYQKAFSQYLQGLSICLKCDLPDTPPDLPPVGLYDVDGPPDDPSIKAIREKHEEQVAARKRAMFEREMIGHQETLQHQIVTLYDEIPFDGAQFRKEADSIIQDGKEVDNLVGTISRYLKEKKR